VYPALAVLQALGENADEILWIGAEGGMEKELVSRAGIPFRSIPAAGLHGVGLRALPGNLLRLFQGFAAARSVLREFRPDVLFFTGGYVAVPVAVAGRRWPALAYVPDTEPALALKSVARFVDRVAVTLADSKTYFPARKPISVTGYPLRREVREAQKAAAFESFDLDPERPLLLVTGGSLGARSINRALMAILAELLPEMQVVHVTGKTTWPEFEGERAALPSELAAGYRAYSYLHSREMAQAYAAADLVVSRGGASTLGEFPYFGLPAILVPYPHAWRYQKVNADYLVRQGGAVMLEDARLSETLLPTIREIMGDPARRKQMAAQMKALAVPDAADKIANILLEMAAGQEGNVTWSN
jgi:UDP-N-acetylglucosamine--N-acetylmuramyl-(pentapeptide) pyrophosphoryl-undecaprenol N-acetylglucosamine transferase